MSGPIRALLCAAVFLVLLGGGAQAQAELRIATEGAYPPFNYVDGNEPAGFEVDLGRALCDAMGLPCRFVLQEWDGMYAGLREKRFDAIMSSLDVTPERRTRYRFSDPYYRMPSLLVGGKDEPAAAVLFDPAALAGRTVGVVRDSEFETYLRGLSPPPTIRTYNKLDEAELDLLTDRIDFVLGDKLALTGWLGTREGQTCCSSIADPPVDRGPGVAVAMRKGDRGLADMFDAALATIKRNGTYDRIRAKYFPFDIR